MAIRDSRGARPKLLLQLFNLKRSWKVLYLVKSPSWDFWSDKSSQNSFPSHANPWAGRTGLQGRNNPPTPFRSTYTYNADQLCWVLELDTEPQTSKWSNLRVLQVEDRFWQVPRLLASLLQRLLEFILQVSISPIRYCQQSLHAAKWAMHLREEQKCNRFSERASLATIQQRSKARITVLKNHSKSYRISAARMLRQHLQVAPSSIKKGKTWTFKYVESSTLRR